MPTNSSINLASRWLRDLVADPDRTKGLSDYDLMNLLMVADNIDRMEERSTSSEYDRGVIEGERRVYARSNLLKNGHELTPAEAKVIQSALASAKVTRVPEGTRTIDPVTNRPYNEDPLARKSGFGWGANSKARKVKKPSLSIDLSSIDL